ncbi:fructose-1,6-bisphosphatase, putative [Eimeria mitis]|uniref:fructose-bisphosphatase n=1 Tax=Eimeria mitis TaxID=44415 RepID=U6K4P2_9EIME|nr:fructose-1,6-bisphosphatase, putative [Eimeria mitis]CDJ31302.1 fructose-1,6-bisphosphatase, putative [Eimeria mitis]
MPPPSAPIPELGEFIIANKDKLRKKDSEAEMNKLLTAIKLAAKVVNREINMAGLVDILGAAGNQNVQGEDQQKLDVFANRKFIQALVNREVVCGICTEEDDDFIPVNPNCHLVLLMDPLDGFGE